MNLVWNLQRLHDVCPPARWEAQSPCRRNTRVWQLLVLARTCSAATAMASKACHFLQKRDPGSISSPCHCWQQFTRQSKCWYSAQISALPSVRVYMCLCFSISHTFCHLGPNTAYRHAHMHVDTELRIKSLAVSDGIKNFSPRADGSSGHLIIMHCCLHCACCCR